MNFNKYGRTAQLFDYQTMSEGLVGGILNSDGTITTNAASSSWTITKYIPVTGREFTLQRQASGGATSICLYDSNQTYITGLAYNGNGTVTASANTDVSYIRFTYYRTENTGNIMLNEGSTALPYEPYGNTWHNTPHYIHTTSTDTFTALPAVLYPNDATATVGLKGQAVQNGTPTPDNPIMPQGTGERTGNLFDYSAITIGYRIQWTNGAAYADDTAIMSDYIPVTEGDYTLNISSIIIGYAADKSYIGVYRSEETWEKLPSDPILSFTVLSNTNVEFVRLLTYGIYSPITDALMLNTGSTPLPYEPYGYKIPISSANTTTPVYLGEVQTTRKIKKVVVTGQEEGWRIHQSLQSWFQLILSDPVVSGFELCTHYKPSPNAPATIQNGEILVNFDGSNNRAIIRDTTYTTLDGFKTYLQQQYAAGTPVCVWYVLATPTTGIVNEPLMRIGDYADEVSGITIPVTTGANTLSVDTTVQPSEVTVNYKGWHPVQSVHEKSRNLFDKSKRTDNSRVVYTTGEIGALFGVFVSDFTPIEPNTTYTLNIVSNILDKTGHLFALYDKNKNFVNTGAHEVSWETTVYTFTTPSNVAYIRFNGNMSSVDSTMLNEGSTALPYEPYWK